MEPLDPYALYRYFDVRDILLYVGRTGDLGTRDSSHISRSRWMELTARSTVERYPTLEDVKKAEREAIETEGPIFNKQFNNTPEAKARMHAYLKEIGRRDLLHPKPRYPNSMLPEMFRPDERAKQEPQLPVYVHEDFNPRIVEDEDAYGARWQHAADRAWWGPWWEERHPLAAEDLLGMTCDVYGITEALGVALRARRTGRPFPIVWVTYGAAPGNLPAEEYNYRWSAHVDFTFRPEEAPPGLDPGELAAQRAFANALIAAGRCTSARIGEQVVLRGFEGNLEAQFAAAVLRDGGEVMARCTARLLGGPDPDLIRESRIAELLSGLSEQSDRDELLRTLEEAVGQRTQDDTSNRRPAA